jgi:hypothetical protein
LKRLLLFLVLAAGGVAVLLETGGDLRQPGRGPHEDAASVEPSAEPHATLEEGHAIPMPRMPVRVPAARGVMVPSEAETLLWHDRASGATIEIPYFFRWRFGTSEVRGLQPEDAGRQGVACVNPVLEVFREPQTREEALALKRGEPGAQDALISHRFSADRARALGRLATRLERRSAQGPALADDPAADSSIRLEGNVRILDLVEGLEIQGVEVVVHPGAGRAEGRGLVRIHHRAFSLEGDGLTVERVAEREWSRVEIARAAVFRVRPEALAEHGPGGVTVRGGGLQPAHLSAEGRAVLVHERTRRDRSARISLFEGVRSEDAGGGSLDAEHLEILLHQAADATGHAPESEARWALREVVAEDNVRIRWPLSEGALHGVVSAQTERLVHALPDGEEPTTTLEGRSTFHFEGDDLLGGVAGDGPSRLRVSCAERAWIGPAAPGVVDADLDPSRLRRFMLRGSARIERHTLGVAPYEDVLEAEEMDFVLHAAPPGAPPGARGSGSPVRFSAWHDVRIGGTRMRGNAQRLLAERLHTDRPLVLLEGPGTNVRFLGLAERERLLGGGSPQAPVTAEPRTPALEWVLSRVEASGELRVDTSLGGPALGIDAQIEAESLGYERRTGLARLAGRPGAPVTFTARTPDGRANHLRGDLFTLDQAAGQIHGRGAVHGELFVTWDEAGHRVGGAALAQHAPSPAAELSIATDERIEVRLVRDARAGEEQVVRVYGPLRAEVRGERNSLDRLRARSLEVAMVQVEAGAGGATPTAPLARAAGPRAESAPSAAAGGGTLRRLELDAAAVRIDLEAGLVRNLLADEGFSLTLGEDRVSGQTLRYDARARSASVDAAPGDWRKRPATAHFRAPRAHTEATAMRLQVWFDEKGVTRLEGEAPPEDFGAVEVYVGDGRTSGRVEWIHVDFWGRVVAGNERVDAGRVRALRRLREPDGTWGPASTLWAPRLYVLGRDLLRSEGRSVARVVAEGERTTVQTGGPGQQVRAWGDVLTVDVATQRASLVGANGRDVTFQKESDPHSLHTRIDLDLASGLPVFLEGSRILWGPPAGARPAAPAAPRVPR